jgi:outer membrane protein assembly factor BamB
MSSNLVYLGLKAHVAAFDKNDGRKLWQTKLKGRSVSGDQFVSLLVEEGHIYAHTLGELFCLDADTGRILWQNELDGLGYDIASLATVAVSNSGTTGNAFRRKKLIANAAAAGAAGGASA